MSVVGGTLLLAVGLAAGTVYIKNALSKRLAHVNLVDPFAGKGHQVPQVVLGAEDVRLETTDPTGGSGALIP